MFIMNKCPCRIIGFVILGFVICTRICFSQAAEQPADDDLYEGERIPLPDKNCKEDDLVCKKEADSLEAIETLHKQIDDDQSGNIDQSESDEFFRDELQNTDGFERQSIFHGKDKQISVRDLWHAWKNSAVYNWTVDDVLDWLVTFVELPQYTSNFVTRIINGTDLPRIAVNNHHYISRDLGIKNPVHKHKLSLKAMDVVLFGPPKKGHNILKDIALVTSLVIALGGCWFAYIQHKYSKEHMKKMMKDLDSLQRAEESLSELNEKLLKAEQEQLAAVVEKRDLEQKYRGEIEVAKEEAERLKTEREDSTLEEMSRLQLAEEELKQVRAALQQAEKELESNCYWMAPTELQHWLQYTFELEQQHFTAKQQAAQKQFGSAKEACEKIRKKRTGMLGTIRIAQGNSIDDIDQRIMQARMALEEIRHDLQERNQRWQAIESFCGFPIRANPGLSKLEAVLYGETASGSSSTSRISTTMVAPMDVEDADEDYPPNFPMAKAMLFHSSKTNGCSGPQTAYSGLSSLADIKRRPVNMGSTSSLPRMQSPSISSVRRDSSENLQKAIPGVGKLKGSTDNLLNKQTMSTSSSNGSSGSAVAFHLGGLSPTTPDSLPDHLIGQGHSVALTENQKMPRSKSTAGVSNLQNIHVVQNGSKIPLRDAQRTITVGGTDIHQPVCEVPQTLAVKGTDIYPCSSSEASFQKKVFNSEAFFQKKVLPKQSAAIGTISGPHGPEDDSASGTESCDSVETKKKDRKLKLIPKFMRRTNHEK